MARTPIWLVTGFLGSGKTTLINNLFVGDWGGDRVAIVVNDLGKVSVDAQRMADSASGMLELPGGCVCCELPGALASGMDDLLDSDAAPFDRIVLEASGIADPTGIVRVLADEPLDGRVSLERQIAVVHAVRHTVYRRGIVQMDRQVKHADVIVMNHYAEAAEEDRRATRTALREVNAEAPIIATTYCKVGSAELAAAPSRTARVDRADAQIPAGWKSCRILFPEPVDRAKLEFALGHLPPNLLRLKGFVRSSSGEILHVERVGEDSYIEPWEGEIAPEALGTLVTVGDPNSEELKSAFVGLPGARVIEDSVSHAH